MISHPLDAKKDQVTIDLVFWQGHKDLNPEPMDLESTTLPIEPYPYII